MSVTFPASDHSLPPPTAMDEPEKSLSSKSDYEGLFPDAHAAQFSTRLVSRRRHVIAPPPHSFSAPS